MRVVCLGTVSIVSQYRATGVTAVVAFVALDFDMFDFVVISCQNQIRIGWLWVG